MKICELLETVNPKIFMQGFLQERKILNGAYILTAKNGYIKYSTPEIFKSDQFRIEAKTSKGVLVAWVNFENINNNLEALDLVVNEKHRRKGIATEMYKFAKDLNNTINPSPKQTALGIKFWNRFDIN
jgi:hypothetical protein